MGRRGITPILVLFIDFMLFAILYSTNNMSEQIFYLLVFVAIICILWYYNQKNLIDYDDARRLVREKVEEQQRNRELPDGTVRLMVETELKAVLLQDSEIEAIEDDKWDVGIIIDGDRTYGYLYSVSIFGQLLGSTEIELPSKFTIRSSPRVKVYKAKKIAKKKELIDKAQRRVQELDDDE